MTPEEQAERKHEERFLKPKASGIKRYAMPEPIDATPDEIARKVLSVKGYAKAKQRPS